MAGRPEASKAGAVSVDVGKSVIDSIDTVFDEVGLPEPGSVLGRLTPRYVADAFGFPTPDDLADDLLQAADEDLGISFPPEL